ncbi:ladinin-1 isoform X2 [Falco biarmicus]|uniref:ladinin-1 isoform X2 n=1 Tax=Falco peregrinus TaxID=8954 RepID=UPI000FFB8276|nr:ladinin-1 isoform X2 [Falco peregrinus]XP_027672567.2 ladinin-1 isoform X2 [Falco cherrug]XP_037266628.1 ladinin-1 isoform X2 [Falco rusticolus]XP_056217947.1 ladinin-1 isoform X2 [Falco biarmicus]
MSFSRRNWSDLSSLARQRTLEDEEEQQRERRRRHRSLLSSTSTDEEPSSPRKDTSPASSRPPSLVKPVPPEDREERKLSEVLKTQEGRRTRSTMAVSEKLRQEKEQQEPGVGASRVEARMQLRAGQQSIQAGEQDQDVAKGRGDPPREQHPEPASERKVVLRGRLQDKERQGVETPRGEPRKEVGEPQQQPELGGCRLREVKILTRQGSRSMEEKAALVVTSSLDQQPSRNPSKEVIQPSPTRDEPAEKSDTSPALVTYSSSIRRTSPRTVSFRVISRKQKEESQSPLTRSTSLRIPGSSTTIGEKLEKYTSAVQRSEVVKSSLNIQKSRLLSSEGVASKRNFFEASVPSKAEPLAVRKDNLKITGSVTSRINLWISRAQEPAKEEKSKDIRKVNSLSNRDVWVKQPGDAPEDTKL